MTNDGSLLEVDGLRVYFRTRSEPIKAVDGVSFAVRRGETAALVGESGCGKSVSALALARLVAHPGFIAGGRVLFGGADVMGMSGGALRRLRGAEFSYVFQERRDAAEGDDSHGARLQPETAGRR